MRVLDLSVMISGPLAAMILADQGAEVVKVESPGLGDIMRFLGTNKGGMTGIFANNNRGKRSLVLDLKQPAGVDVLARHEGAPVLVREGRVWAATFHPEISGFSAPRVLPVLRFTYI
jgi:crotonobetainyl-CoA:carnitine CoA-transferase CaiB-like acyl-CoA transferase